MINGIQYGAILNNGTALCTCTNCFGAGEEGSAWGVVSDSNFVYALWQDSGVNVFKCPKGGGASVIIYQDSSDTNCALVSTSTAIYWSTNASGGRVYRLVK